MSVYKEGYALIKLIAANSEQIFPDAADYGMPVEKGDVKWNWVKQLAEWYGDKSTRTHHKYSTGSTTSIEICLMDEWRPPYPEERFLLKVISHREKGKMKMFVECYKKKL